ncbi:MAG TPA: selenide, water dikinase SelD [Bacteroidales bacterium]|nr:selenide, water dikinase SelD [Bacteroidales bacterium]
MHKLTSFDLLSTVEYGGCSAKLPAKELSKALADLPKTPHKNLLVDIETHDDAGVYKITDEIALIQTTDFFPPVCANAYEFGQIAAANALSDIYAMGGEAITALNIAMFPAKIPLAILNEILRGGIDKVLEAGAVIIGGHTIVDDVPKYGLAVTGTIHPNKIITNAGAKEGDVLLLTKPIGCGIILAGNRIGEVKAELLQTVLNSMKQLNKNVAQIMQNNKIKCATDVTGFGLIGHALKMALASNVTLRINSKEVPVFEKVIDLVEMGCIPGACFRNLEYVAENCLFNSTLSYNLKMLLLDAQTSGGMLICCQPNIVNEMKTDLINAGFPFTSVIGEITKKEKKDIVVY